MWVDDDADGGDDLLGGGVLGVLEGDGGPGCDVGFEVDVLELVGLGDLGGEEDGLFGEFGAAEEEAGFVAEV